MRARDMRAELWWARCVGLFPAGAHDRVKRMRPNPRWFAVAATACLVTGCGRIPTSPSAVQSSSSAPSGATTCEFVETGTAARPVRLPSSTGVPTSGTVTYLLEMTNGPVRLTLDRVKAPCTVHSFESLADQGFFTKTRCPRLVDKTIFILQCGDPTGTGTGGPGYTFADETDGTESYVSGVVAMASSGPNTNGSQFFLVWDDSSSLDETAGATIFGSMDTTSRDVVASMAEEGQDGSNPRGGGKPNNPSEILSVTRE
jgi:peptidyl-prolyl cis-trans isomerase B (cyclophilin B)